MAPKPPSKSQGPPRTAKARKSATAGPSSSNKSKIKRPPPKQVKTKPGTHAAGKAKKRQRVYTDKELNLPALNMITPVGVQKPRGKKKGKIFVDDREGMMTILALVNAEKEGQIESKMIKARQMEEIREARRIEAEKRRDSKKEKLEDVKKSLKKRKRVKEKGDGDGGEADGQSAGPKTAYTSKKLSSSKKRVSFA